MSQCITGMNHPDSSTKSLGEYGLTGLQVRAIHEGSHEFKVTKPAWNVYVCVCVVCVCVCLCTCAQLSPIR